ncbi:MULTISPECIES: hypothetical protein [unclassified Kribbella]|uniref:hypothetical protein n=1 Tax=unclassified Kribbella TaxID=2644121 RepID=UPI0030784E81
MSDANEEHSAPQRRAPQPFGQGQTPPQVTSQRRLGARRSSWLDQAPRILDVAARVVCLLAGVGVLVTGLVGLFSDVDEAVLAMVLAVGVLLLITPSIVDRIRAMKLGQFEVQLVRQVAASAREAANTLQRLGLGRELDAYATVYTELRGPELRNVRAMVLDRIIERVSSAAVVEKFDQNEVKTMFREGTPIVRVLALGLMEGDPSLIDGEILLEAVSRSLTGNEQYHALRLARDEWHRLSPADHAALRSAIDASPHLKDGSARADLAQQIRALSG